MRTVVLLSVLLVVLFIAGCNQQPAAPPAPPQPQYNLDFPIEEVMEHIIMPSADQLWSAVETNVTAKGIEEKVPKTDEEWQIVKHFAVTLDEGTNLLIMPGRRVSPPGAKAADVSELAPEEIEARIHNDPAMWASHVKDLRDVAQLMVKATDMKSPDALIDAGDKLDKACEACHLVYWYPPKPGAKS